MKWMRLFVPKGLALAGIVSATVVGIAVAAQNQDEPQNNQPQPAPAAAQKAPAVTTDTPAPGTVDRAQPKANQRPVTLGAQFEAQGNQGLRITTIEQNGALAQSGLKQNDRVISIDGLSFSSPRQVEAYLWAHAGRPLPFVVDRGGQQVTIQSTIPMPTSEGGWLGVFLDEGDPNVKGARVTQVYPAGPAARGGLHIGDVITQIDTKPVTHSADAVMLIRELQPKSEIVLTVVRGKEEEKITVVVGSRNNSVYQSFYGGSQQQNSQFGQQPGDPNMQQFHGVPPYAMQLENDRRMAEQHERIEDEIRLLREEIQKLREALQKK